jgi:hypothetical protein
MERNLAVSVLINLFLKLEDWDLRLSLQSEVQLIETRVVILPCPLVPENDRGGFVY